MTAHRPVLRYHGGKWLLAPWVISHFPRHRVYVEPFGGAASVLLRKQRAYAEVYNDLDGEIVSLFRVLRDPLLAQRLEQLLRLTPFARTEFDESYEPCADPVENARRTVVRSFMGFGSAGMLAAGTGFRSCSNRSGTTPAHDWKNYPDCLAAMTVRLQGIVVENRPACEVLQQYDSSRTLHYVDPPYPKSTRGKRHATCYRHEMIDADHSDLLTVLRGLAGMVVLSGYPCDLYDNALLDWHRIERKALADGAHERTEVLWLSPNAVARSRSLFSGLTP
jgi:DNA adenine methylase